MLTYKLKHFISFLQFFISSKLKIHFKKHNIYLNVYYYNNRLWNNVFESNIIIATLCSESLQNAPRLGTYLCANDEHFICSLFSLCAISSRNFELVLLLYIGVRLCMYFNKTFVGMGGYKRNQCDVAACTFCESKRNILALI